MSASGLLVIDKPSGPTSHDVVDSVRRLFDVRRVGHAGTLDPPATGILLLGLGRATRLLTFLQALAKTYRAKVQFGVMTSTGDSTGEVIGRSPCSFSARRLAEVCEEFTGELDQVPPMVSAVKVHGEPLYAKARRGEEVERRPRKIRIYRIDVRSFDQAAFEADLEVECSSGTYIRALATDIGAKLGCGAHVAELRRTSIGTFREEEAQSLPALEAMTPPQRLEYVLPPLEAMRDFPRVQVDDAGARAVSHGRPLEDTAAARPGELTVNAAGRPGGTPPHQAGMTAGIPVAVVGPEGRLLAVYRRHRGGLRPAVVLG